MAFWNRKKKLTQVLKRPGTQPDAPPRKASWVQRREETKEEERLRAESAKTGIAMGPIKPSGELTPQQKLEKEALGQVGHMRRGAEGKAPTTEEAAMHQLLRDAQARQTSEETPEGGTTQPLERTTAATTEGQRVATSKTVEGAKPTLSERRAAAIDSTRLKQSVAKMTKEVKSPEGKTALRVGVGDSEAKG